MVTCDVCWTGVCDLVVDLLSLFWFGFVVLVVSYALTCVGFVGGCVCYLLVCLLVNGCGGS